MPIDPELAKEADAGMIEMFAGDYLDGAAQAVAETAESKPVPCMPGYNDTEVLL